MKFSTTLLATLLPLLSLAAPTPEAEAKVEERQTITCPGNSGGGCGVYTVSGLGTRKKAVIAAGGTSLDLAIAMMETEGMNTNYAYGDNKSGDAANFGIFKQNWYMIRSTSSTFSGQTASQYNNGAALNSNLALDVTTRKNAQNYYGWDKWAGGHRNGQTGLNSPYTNDINLYKTAVLWTQSQINSNSAYLTDDTRFWVDVVAI
ncbi:uncharacterized protein LAJ45_01565 [Morchella importuna]|uniref:Uncharacterized protein n=1 Tax=Morchella conica CCBAS932 TaxID=1392247 RepID=A0A3N4KN32_9PEZI|nr:uncharacterized protein LAJ45_01565 [Morchella importuna]KAH8153798.1 hypothetical protein LAJ45_01565 [Morchella importuna]RPB09761.1 hypothetical protein P167DRAFT_607793 [Morchella conica CCBAS932]